jgi:hypothetical protein
MNVTFCEKAAPFSGAHMHLLASSYARAILLTQTGGSMHEAVCRVE